MGDLQVEQCVMIRKKKGFYIFCLLIMAFMGLCVWAVYTSLSWNDLKDVREVNTEKAADVPPSTSLLAANFRPHPTDDAPAKQDTTMMRESLEQGAEPTQDLGERGSLNGALITDNPLTYNDSRFQRLENSPLYLFTDDMIRQTSEDTYEAKREALTDQAKHLQEASIALSVSPRVEYGKTTGYRLVEIPEGTLFSRLGMVSGDVVVSINGTVPDMEPMALMFVRMAAGQQGVSTIVVDHRGTERTIHLRAVE